MFRVRCSFFNLIYTPGIPEEKKSRLKTFIFHPPRIGTNKSYFFSKVKQKTSKI